MRAFVPRAEAMGVPGAVMVAQAVLESRWGRSGLARLGRAWYGIKATASWPGAVYSGTTREWMAGRGDALVLGRHRVYPSRAAALAAGCAPGSLFRAYPSVAQNVGDYLRFFRVNPRYHPALRAYRQSRDARRFALDIARAGYATAPDYARRLIAVMEQVAADLLPARSLSLWLLGRYLPSDALLVRGGRVYLRVRALAAALGWRVAYDPQRKAVYLGADGEEGG
ncbi:MAG: glucosaminidase domain-containing protein [Armatimonadota bacterium]|nr:glucosaminidase domain-containing protein [Armatimonadota bacterium]